MKRTHKFLYLNAVLAHLHHYPNSQYAEDYKELKNELINTPTVRKRGRKATRQRKKETTSDTTSKEENKAIKT